MWEKHPDGITGEQLGMTSYPRGPGLGCGFLLWASFHASIQFLSTCYVLGTVLCDRDIAGSTRGRNACFCGLSACAWSSWAHSCPHWDLASLSPVGHTLPSLLWN